MTDVIVVRMDRKQRSRLDAAARKRSVSRSTLVRQALNTFLEAEPPKNGVGWPERFAELQRKGRVIKGSLADEIREIDRNRWR